MEVTRHAYMCRITGTGHVYMLYIGDEHIYT